MTASRWIPSVVLVLVAGCTDNAPLGQSAADAGAAFAAAPQKAGGEEKRPPDGVYDTPRASSPPGAPTSCAALATGGAPDTLNSFMWERQVPEGPGSDAWDYVWIE